MLHNLPFFSREKIIACFSDVNYYFITKFFVASLSSKTRSFSIFKRSRAILTTSLRSYYAATRVNFFFFMF